MELIEGTFLERINRFTLKFSLDGKTYRAYLPNPGRLWEILQKGRKIYVEKNPHSTFKYRVWAAEKEREVILLYSSYCNKIAQDLIVKFFGYEIIKKEPKFLNHRFDFLIKDKGEEFFVEVKSVTLFKDEFSMFPDAPTKRGKEHINLLKNIGKGMVLFITSNSKVRYFLPEFHTDPQFSRALYEGRNSLKIIPLVLKFDKNLNYEMVRIAKIPWKIYEREAKGKGSYIFSGYLGRKKWINFGKDKKFLFEKGWYLYVGSGMGSLEGRIKRHLRKRKKTHWHLDYLRENLKKIRVFPIYSSKRLECKISKELSKISTSYVKFFGSSDCLCPSHLFYFKENPLKNQNFIEMLLDLRMKKLSGRAP
ncbi:MAG: DNA/RNA nuclease SfsA [Thermoanaerobaculia bacterium]